ncbi:FAD-binding oxidoreductase [Kiloniella laminariae]|uniref:FAD-binding oxidoreductase n=1 Tax=Kiloniella laminariae TaxID=454162 RepID=A0ABT4LI29_9PROT|nr:FAD-binding oxidoreductase [Kiloniella laminariae]MCZ4280765.1 FAD-binding oxidoreductase [Kiloniella laminariae]
MATAKDKKKRVLIIGSGIVGLCSANYLLRDGCDVTIVERDPLGDGTSCGNAGAIAAAEVAPYPLPGLWKSVPGWLMDPLGPLSLRLSYLPQFLPWLYLFLKSCNQTKAEASAKAMSSYLGSAFDDYKPLLGSAGLEGLLKKEGTIFVYKSDKGLALDNYFWDLTRRNGVTLQSLNQKEIHEREPALGPQAYAGVYTPDWGHFANPGDLVHGLARLFQENRGNHLQGEVESFEIKDNKPVSVRTRDGQRIEFDQLIIAAGAWSARLSAKLGDKFPLDTERGYNTTLPNPDAELNNMVVFAEDKFVATPMNIGLRVGGAVEFAGIEAEPNYARCDTLLQLAKGYLPTLNGEGGTRWMGRRPSTPDSLPVISPSRHHDNVHYAFGHGHLGITGGAVTGRTIANMIAGRPGTFDPKPFHINRFD